MACHFARRSGRFFQRQLDVQMGRRCNVDERIQGELGQLAAQQIIGPGPCQPKPLARFVLRSEEHTSELQSLMRISYAVFCLKKKTNRLKNITTDPSINRS